jgi:uncharacterized membrane protein
MSASGLLEGVAAGVGVIGVVVIVWGVAVAAVATARVELANLRHQQLPKARVKLRQQLGSSLLLGLEFLIAADVIRTILQPTLEEVAILGGIVAIRTVISYFLHKEMADERLSLSGDETAKTPSGTQ